MGDHHDAGGCWRDEFPVVGLDTGRGGARGCRGSFVEFSGDIREIADPAGGDVTFLVEGCDSWQEFLAADIHDERDQAGDEIGVENVVVRRGMEEEIEDVAEPRDDLFVAFGLGEGDPADSSGQDFAGAGGDGGGEDPVRDERELGANDVVEGFPEVILVLPDPESDRVGVVGEEVENGGKGLFGPELAEKEDGVEGEVGGGVEAASLRGERGEELVEGGGVDFEAVGIVGEEGFDEGGFF